MGLLAGEPALVEELLLLRRRHTAERGVAVREAAEADDDVAVDGGPLKVVLDARLGDQGQAVVLVAGSSECWKAGRRNCAEWARPLSNPASMAGGRWRPGIGGEGTGGTRRGCGGGPGDQCERVRARGPGAYARGVSRISATAFTEGPSEPLPAGAAPEADHVVRMGRHRGLSCFLTVGLRPKRGSGRGNSGVLAISLGPLALGARP